MIEPLPYDFKRIEKYMGKEDEVTVSLDFPFTILIDKLNEVIGDYEHLKEVVLCRQLEKNKSDTASNQSNTEPTLLGIDPASEDGDKGCKVYGYYDGEKFVVTRYEEELPQKIKLLAEFAGYPAGEYELEMVGGILLTPKQMYVPVSQFRNRSNFHIHPDIIKATSGQGIRSEVTDGEEHISRSIEVCKVCYGMKKRSITKGEMFGWGVPDAEKYVFVDCKRCNGTGTEPTTESVSHPIDETDKCYLIRGEDGHLTCNHNHKMGADCLMDRDCKPTPDPYEECANALNRSPILGDRGLDLEVVIKVLKKHFPPLSLT